MRGFLRKVRLAGLVALAAIIIVSVGRLDRVLGSGHLLLGLALGLFSGAAAVLAFIVLVNRRVSATEPTRTPPLREDPPAGFDWTILALDGAAFPMEQLRGEAFLLNVWSTLCPPCVAELASLERLHDSVRDHGVRVLCVATDDDPERVRRLAVSKNWHLPLYLLGQAEIPKVFDSDYIPATYVVNAEGRVVMQHVGAALWDHPRVVTFLRALALKNAITTVEAKAAG